MNINSDVINSKVLARTFSAILSEKKHLTVLSIDDLSEGEPV